MDQIKEQSDLEKEFMDTLTPFQKIAYNIAVKNLESSFSLEKCIGFLEFKEQKIKEKLKEKHN
jgi:hypothetical protein